MPETKAKVLDECLQKLEGYVMENKSHGVKVEVVFSIEDEGELLIVLGSQQRIEQNMGEEKLAEFYPVMKKFLVDALNMIEPTLTQKSQSNQKSQTLN